MCLKLWRNVFTLCLMSCTVSKLCPTLCPALCLVAQLRKIPKDASTHYTKARMAMADIYLKHRKDKAAYIRCYIDLVVSGSFVALRVLFSVLGHSSQGCLQETLNSRYNVVKDGWVGMLKDESGA